MTQLEEKARAEEKMKAGWKWRALDHTKLNKTQIGAQLLAILKIKPNSGSYLNRSGFIISTDGWVMGELIKEDGSKSKHLTILGTVRQYTDSFRHLADELKLDDAERADLFRFVRESIQKDLRLLQDKDTWK